MASQSIEADDVILTLPNDIAVRRYRLTDIKSISRHANNRAVWNNMRNRMPQPYLPKDAEFWISSQLDPKNHIASGAWSPPTGAQGPLVPAHYAITVHDEAIGSIGLEFNDLAEIYFRSAEVGYWIGQEFWGRGIMGIVVPAFVDWGWKTFGVLVRMNAEVHAWNSGSQKCLEKAGFLVEGKKRFAFVKNGVLGDSVVLGMIRPDFEGDA